MPEIPPKSIGVYRVIHSADWHLGKTLADLSREEEHDLFLAFLLDLIQRESVDALIVAGDVFDSANPPQSALSRYYNFLWKIYETTRCSVVVIAGNHDSPAQIEAPRQVLSPLRVQVVGALPDSVEALILPLPPGESPRLLVAALPFLRDRDVRTGQSGQSAAAIQKDIAEGIARRYAEAAGAARNLSPHLPILATGHLTVAGSSASDSEREIHVGGLGAVGPGAFPDALAYVALGHLHRPQSAGGRDTIRYSGSPIPLSFSEAGDQKEVRLLDFLGAELVRHQPVPIPTQRHLVQLSCQRSSLEQRLRSFQPPPSPLPAWVEVVVEDPVPGENLFELVQEYASALSCQIIRVVGKRGSGLPGLTSNEESSEDVADRVLDDPKAVFAVRLEREVGLSDEEKDAVSLAFNELITLYEEGRRGETLVLAAGPEPVEVAP